MNFAKQKKRLDPLLKHPNNHTCADCNALAPTWASLDFGVFLCSSCSGAHRALGPTITRVKSTHLDLWEEEWYRNMVIGNEKLNKYWQSNPMSAVKKPKSGATNMEVERFVYEKYIKRKYVTDLNCPDPLTAYKRNNYQFQEEPKTKQNEKAVQKQKTEVMPAKVIPAKKVQNLIDFDFEREAKSQSPLVATQIKQMQKIQTCEPAISASNNNNTSARYSEIGTSFTTQNSKDDFISFDQLLKTQKTQQNSLQHSLSTQQITKPAAILATNYYHPYHQHLPTQNLVYNSYLHPSSSHVFQLNYLHSHSPQPQANHFSGQYQHAAHFTSNIYVGAPVNTGSFNWS